MQAHTKQTEAHAKQTDDKLRNLFNRIDLDRSGMIEIDEFIAALDGALRAVSIMSSHS